MAKLVLITGLEAMQLRVPRRSMRPPYEINRDCARIDRRCFRRYVRRFVKHYGLRVPRHWLTLR